MTVISPLTKEDVKSVIAGRSTSPRVPVYIHFWVHPDTFEDREPAVREILSRYPEDLQLVPFAMPNIHDSPPDDPEYRWVTYPDPYAGKEVAIDERIAMRDWSRLDEIIEKFPRAGYPGLFKWARPADGRYRLAHWFFCLFERHWSLRGMTNALLDYYEHPEEVHRLFRALTDFYKGIILRSAKEQKCDGLWISDDLGTQTGPFFSTAMFREFYKPYYKEMIDVSHENGMDCWMHACGNVEAFIPEWLDIGLDVLHPIQKYTMDEKVIAAKFGKRLTVFAGLEVQQVIPWGTPEEVRQEVRFLIDTYWRPGEGRCMITAGNGINGDCTLASLEAFFDESFSYGRKKVSG